MAVPILIRSICIILCLNNLKSFSQAHADFSASVVAGCSPITVSFNNLSTGASSWQWDLGNGTLSTVKNPSTTYIAPGTYTVKLVASNGTDTSTITKTGFINVYANPSVNFEINQLTGCFPLTASLGDRSSPGSGAVNSWLWDFGDGTIANVQNPTHTFLNMGVFNVSLTVKNNFGCSQTISKPNFIMVTGPLHANFSASVAPPCVVPAIIQFTDFSTGDSINGHFWDFGDGQTSTDVSPSHMYTAIGTYTVTLKVGNVKGCADVISRTVSIGITKADFYLAATSCSNTMVSIVNTSSPISDLKNSYWIFDDGSTDNVVNPQKTFGSPGSHLVTLTADFGGCTATVTKNIEVLTNPVPSFTASVVSACAAPLTTTFTNTTPGGTVVKWRFGDGYSSDSSQPVHTFTAPGDYTVRLTAANANGCKGETSTTAFIHIGNPKIVNIVGPPYRGCIPYLANFSAIINPANQAVTYHWDFGDGSTSTQAAPSHNYSVEGNYDVSLTITAVNGGCTDTKRILMAVSVGTKPHAAFSASPLVVCPGVNVYFVDSSTKNPNQYTWSFGDGDTSRQSVENPIKSYGLPGYKTVTLIVARNGCSDNITRTDYIYVKPPDVKAIDSFVCSNQHQHDFQGISAQATTYLWDFGDGTTSMLQNPSHFYKDTGRYFVFLQVDKGECPSAGAKVYVLNEIPTFNATDSVGCNATAKFFIPAPADWNIERYFWDFGDGNTVSIAFDSSVSPLLHNYNADGTYRVNFGITDLNHCQNSIVQPVAVTRYGPKAGFGVPPKICINVSQLFEDQSVDKTSKIVKWIWDFDDNSGLENFAQPPFYHTYKKSNVYSVSLIVTDSMGCSDTVYKPDVVLVQAPKANFTATDTVHCLSSSLQFFNLSSGNITASHWDFGDGDTSNLASPNHVYTQAGRFDVKLNVTDDAGCKKDTTIASFINIANTKTAFSIDDSISSCPPLVVTFTNQTVNLAQAKWDFGNGNTSTLFNASNIYIYPGVYSVKLVTTGNGGCVDSLTKKISIAGPIGDFSYDNFGGCIPVAVNFSSRSSNTTTYIWDFNDGEIDSSNAATTKHVYHNLGTYLPKIILEDSTGCKVPIAGKDSIKVKGVKAYIKSLPRYLFCDSGIVTFFDSTISNDIVSSFQWSFGDGGTSVIANPTHTYTPGIYYANYWLTTALGCTSSDTLKIPVKVVQSPHIMFSPPNGICVPATVQFAGQMLAADTSAVQWFWNFGNGRTAAVQDPAAQFYGTPGQYKIIASATNSSGCSDTVQQVLTVYPLPLVKAGQSKFICRGQQDTLSVSGASSYVWESQPSLSCTNCSSPVAKPLFDQLYKVIGTDVNGCTSKDSVLIKVKQPFTMTVGNAGVICLGQSAQLNAAGAEAYIWSPNNQISSITISNPIVSPSTSKVYQVIGYDTIGCFKDTGFIQVTVFPIPTVDVLEDKEPITVGSSIQLHTSFSADVTKLHWEPATGLSCINCANPLATPKQDVVYNLTVTNGGGCTAQDNVSITVVCNNGNVFIPNTFSPNGDGVNDVFYPRGKGIYGIKAMRIFSRWGEMIFEKTNFQPNDISSGWNGTYKGQQLPADVFVYLIDVICDNNEVFSLKGNITLLR